MAKALAVHENEVRASTASGPLVKTKQPASLGTVSIAVVGTYQEPEPCISTTTTTAAPAPRCRADLPDKFLALLSLTPPPATTPTPAREQRRIDRITLETFLQDSYGYPSGIYCARVDAAAKGPLRGRLPPNPAFFCDQLGGCSHGPAPDTFPGDKEWTFEVGEERSERVMAPRVNKEGDVAPEEGEWVGVLRELRGMVERAVEGGMKELRVFVSQTDGMVELAETEALEKMNKCVVEEIERWVAMGWVETHRHSVVGKPMGVTRNVGIVGTGSVRPFKVFDEEEAVKASGSDSDWEMVLPSGRQEASDGCDDELYALV